MAFFTGKGDGGTSKLFRATTDRINKDAPIFEALGTVDELNSFIGLMKARAAEEKRQVFELPFRDILHDIQEKLFVIQAELAGADKQITNEAVAELEKLIQQCEAALPPVTSFFIPGSTEIGSVCDYARTLARRAERRVVSVQTDDATRISPTSLQYLNRLSSVLYALARVTNRADGGEEAAPRYI